MQRTEQNNTNKNTRVKLKLIANFINDKYL